MEELTGTPLGRSLKTLISLKLRTGGKYDRLFKAFGAVRKFLNDKRKFSVKDM